MVLKDLCILCCSFKEDTIEIFGEHGVQQNIAATLSKHFWFEVKVVHHFSRVICLRCWTITKDFNTFYTTIERAQSEFIANATIDDAEEISSVSSRTDSCHKQLKATFLQNDSVSLNSLNAGIYEPDHTFGELGANYEILNFELLTDDLLQKIINDESMRMEMEVGDAERSDGNSISKVTKIREADLAYTNKAMITDHVKKSIVSASQPRKPSKLSQHRPVTISTSSTSTTSHHLPTSGINNLVLHNQIKPQTLPQILSNKSKNLVILSEPSPQITNVSQPPPVFTIIPPQYAPITSKSTSASNKPSHQYPYASSSGPPFAIRNASGQLVETATSLKNSSNLVMPEYRITSPGCSSVTEIPSTLPPTYANEVMVNLPFHKNDKYNKATSIDSGYSPSQSTMCSLTPQYFLNCTNSNDSGILSNATTVILLTSPKDSTDSSSIRLQNFSDTSFPYSAKSISSIHSGDSSSQLRSFSETASVYSVDSGHPNDSPSQLQNFSDVASQYSVASVNSNNPNQSPEQPQHYTDVGMEYTTSSGHRNESPNQLQHFNDAASQYSVTSVGSSHQNGSAIGSPMQLQNMNDIVLEYSISPANGNCTSDFPVELPSYLNDGTSYYTDASVNMNYSKKSTAKQKCSKYTPFSVSPLNTGASNKLSVNFNGTDNQFTSRNLSHSHESTGPPQNLSHIPLEYSFSPVNDGYTNELPMQLPDFTISTTKYSANETAAQNFSSGNNLKTTHFSKPVDLMIAKSPAQTSTANLQDFGNPAESPDQLQSFANSPSSLYELSGMNSSELSPPIDIQDYFNVASQYSDDSGILSSSGESPAQSSGLSEASTSLFSPREMLCHSSAPVQLPNCHETALFASTKLNDASEQQQNHIDFTALHSITNGNAPHFIQNSETPNSDRTPLLEPMKKHLLRENTKTTNDLSDSSKSELIGTIASNTLRTPELLIKSQPPNKTIATSSTTVTTSSTGKLSQCSTSSGILQKLVDSLPQCAVILERIDYRNTIRDSETIQDLNTVQNSIPKQYIIDRRNNKRNRNRIGKIYPENSDELFREFCKLSCEICNRNFETFFDIVNHYRQTHDTPGFIRCCKRKFFYRGTLLDHISEHRIPDKYRCNICQYLCPSKKRFNEHMMEKHLQTKSLVCSQCPKIFHTKKLLQQHILLCHHSEEEKNFICPHCGRRFMHKSFLNSHVKQVHDLKNMHVCEYCSKTVKCKTAFENHLLSHLNVDMPKLECNICGARLKNDNSLRKHLRRHNDTTHTCELCNKEYPNRLALDGHVRYMHGERDHHCTMCEKTFRKAIELKEHMVKHTGEILYRCPYCSMRFKRTSTMYRHKKSKHPTEWNRDKGKIMVHQSRIPQYC